MTVRGIDAAWLPVRVAESTPVPAAPDDEFGRLRELLLRCAHGFCTRRGDVISSRIARGRVAALGSDEACRFLRTFEHGSAPVDDAGGSLFPAREER